MIIDRIENVDRYKMLSASISKAIDHLKTHDLQNTENGKYEIEGEKIFVIVQEYYTKLITEGKMEAHKKYIDIQVMLRGNECIGYKLLKDQNPTVEYSAEKDVHFFDKETDNYFSLNEGEFALFYPWDLHMPSLVVTESTLVKKAVFKILFS